MLSPVDEKVARQMRNKGLNVTRDRFIDGHRGVGRVVEDHRIIGISGLPRLPVARMVINKLFSNHLRCGIN
jgi:hypothetical protein